MWDPRATMKFVYSAVIVLAEVGSILALPASSTASTSAVSVAKPTSAPGPSKDEQTCLLETICIEFDTPMIPVWDDGMKKCSCKPQKDVVSKCLASTTCIVGSSPFWDSKTRKCTCIPKNLEEQKCLQDTICVEYDVPMVPDWDNISRTCYCKPREDEAFICIAATTCIPGSSPFWDAATKKCNCLKTDTAVEAAKRDVVPQDKPTKTISPAPTPTPSVDKCTLLKILCPCGDRHSHWNEDLQRCACQPCEPPPDVVCENYKIYCGGGDHKMHWDPISASCQCLVPMITDYAPEPAPTA
ncbi:hypothetical protein ONS95_007406 [Cadophora gregata]|uniref:uncharacterized protein n=1 Tax=Cadophora gregata TaxID=51156 RepID=UPI0026DC0888|nr:uncharacterized protein ONS95_007406 [Cadophora gregata]KAK0118515.1 hypothetical protein ONS96_011612 [Cadophora gregata f. sp. sojae]KAK0125773.1 hypothetical protein ONS95_007406 [Cadophora gregata]